MEVPSKLNYDRFLKLVFIGGIALTIAALFFGLFEDAHSQGLPEPFKWFFAAAGFTIFVFILPSLMKRLQL